MSGGARQASGRRPSTIAIHDDRNVRVSGQV
jgi:hypothetical protein